MKATILFSDGRLINLDLRQKFYTIGRHLSCSVCLSPLDLAVSNRHATIFRSDRNTWVVTDGDLITGKSSRGGLIINGQKLDANHGHELQNGDIVQLSIDTLFYFFLESHARQTTEGDTVL
jgi:pSer/pThr/pTyr-binding forkhead associated (FHA) protein